MNGSSNSKLIAVLKQNWQAEMEGVHAYQALASRETDPVRKRTLNSLALAEKHHAALWGQRIKDLGEPLPAYEGKPEGYAVNFLNRIGGSDLALRRLEIDESRDIAKYGNQLKSLGDEKSLAILAAVLEDEREHYRELSTLLRGRYGRNAAEGAGEDPKTLLESMLAKRSGAGRQTAGWIGDAIYGVNDGLGAIFGIVSGVSGATLGNQKFVLLAGLSGMIASALSMGSGAYLAAKSEREIYEAEVGRERDAIEMNGAEAEELLSLYYQVKGLPVEDADKVVEHIAKDPALLLKALASERLNSTEEGLRNPTTSALSGALSTALGAFIPVIPFFFLSGYPAVIWAAIISLLAHFAVGAAKSLITVRSWWSSGSEMTVIGAIEGVVTYVIGIGLGRIGS